MKTPRWIATATSLRPGEDALEVGVWYRSPLWEAGHLLGRTINHTVNQISWCGRGLDYARDFQDPVLGGLFLDDRADNSRCAYCKRSEAGWLSVKH